MYLQSALTCDDGLYDDLIGDLYVMQNIGEFINGSRTICLNVN